MTGKARLTYEEMETVLVEAVINNRLLTYLFNNDFRDDHSVASYLSELICILTDVLKWMTRQANSK